MISHLRFIAIAIAIAGGVTCAIGLSSPKSAHAADSADPTASFSLERRVRWTSSRIFGTPDPPLPYVTKRAYPNLVFDRPTEITRAPGTNRMFVVELAGRIVSFENREDVDQVDVFLDIRDRVANPQSERNPNQRPRLVMWAMTFHPNWRENGYVYVSYGDTSIEPDHNRICRYTMTWNKGEPPRCDPDSQVTLIEYFGTGHNGGSMQFGPDGYFYISVGDGGSGTSYDDKLTGQDISDFRASILRIDVNRSENGKPYAVPKDNPFVDLPGAAPEVWAFGFRNPWKMSFDPATGDLWVGDVGQNLWEMVYRVVRGGNYGWSVTEGPNQFRPNRKVGPTPILPPTFYHPHAESTSVTGGYAYHGTQFPDLRGAYVYGDYDTGKIWALRHEEGKVTWQAELADTDLRIVGFGLDNHNEIVMVDHMIGTAHRLAKSPPVDPTRGGEAFPRKLSETGLFANVAEHTPALGLIPFSVNTPQWSDGATAERWIAIPGDATIQYHPRNVWTFPDGTVLVKTLSTQMNAADPSSTKRIETQLLHIEQQHFRYYTYMWNDQQTDAELVERDGADRVYLIRDAKAPGGMRVQPWRFASRSQCSLCHTKRSGFALGFNLLQLNRVHDYGAATVNQIEALDGLGIFTYQNKNHEPKDYGDLPRLVNPYDESNPIDLRARSYLHANCSHCHQRGGGGNAEFSIVFDLPMVETETLDTPPGQGDFGMPDARIIAPGDPGRSMVIHRMSTLGAGRMPPMASTIVDQPAVNLIRQWIEQLKNPD